MGYWDGGSRTEQVSGRETPLPESWLLVRGRGESMSALWDMRGTQEKNPLVSVDSDSKLDTSSTAIASTLTRCMVTTRPF